MEPCFPEFCSLHTDSATRKSCKLKWVLRITQTYTAEFINNLSLITSFVLSNLVHIVQQWYFMSKFTARYRENSWKWSSFSVFSVRNPVQISVHESSPESSFCTNPVCMRVEKNEKEAWISVLLGFHECFTDGSITGQDSQLRFDALSSWNSEVSARDQCRRRADAYLPRTIANELTNERWLLVWRYNSSLLWLVNSQFERSGGLSSNLQSTVVWW